MSLPRCACGFVMPAPGHARDCKLYDPARIYPDPLPLDKTKVVEAATNLMRLCMQCCVRQQIDLTWGEGQTELHVNKLCKVLGITYP